MFDWRTGALIILCFTLLLALYALFDLYVTFEKGRKTEQLRRLTLIQNAYKNILINILENEIEIVVDGFYIGKDFFQINTNGEVKSWAWFKENLTLTALADENDDMFHIFSFDGLHFFELTYIDNVCKAENLETS